ncbi:Sigma-70, region 4 [compost metagenome]
MCYIDGIKQKEVAEQLNISPLTVKAHLRDATKTIRNFMGGRSDLSVLLFLFFYTIK